MYIHTYTYIHTHTYIHMYIRTYVCTYIHTYVHTYVQTNKQYIQLTSQVVVKGVFGYCVSQHQLHKYTLIFVLLYT